MATTLRSCWQNCILPDDQIMLRDKELAAIDAMEDSLAPLDEDTARIRQLITSFESCYHEADKQAALIIKAIGSGRPPEKSHERPPKRKQELQNARDILLAWCEDRLDEVRDSNVGGILAGELVSFIGDRTALKIWQVQRIVDKVSQALDPSRKYHNMALSVGENGRSSTEPVGRHYKDQPNFLKQTKAALINDTIDNQKAQISLAMAIDRLQPCNWNFVGNFVVILTVIGGDLYPNKPFACCERNILLTPLRERLKIISDTLRAFWQGQETDKNIDDNILTALGQKTPVKSWLAASLDKTIRSQLDPVNVKRMTEWVEEWTK